MKSAPFSKKRFGPLLQDSDSLSSDISGIITDSEEEAVPQQTVTSTQAAIELNSTRENKENKVVPKESAHVTVISTTAQIHSPPVAQTISSQLRQKTYKSTYTKVNNNSSVNKNEEDKIEKIVTEPLISTEEDGLFGPRRIRNTTVGVTSKKPSSIRKPSQSSDSSLSGASVDSSEEMILRKKTNPQQRRKSRRTSVVLRRNKQSQHLVASTPLPGKNNNTNTEKWPSPIVPSSALRKKEGRSKVRNEFHNKPHQMVASTPLPERNNNTNTEHWPSPIGLVPPSVAKKNEGRSKFSNRFQNKRHQLVASTPLPNKNNDTNTESWPSPVGFIPLSVAKQNGGRSKIHNGFQNVDINGYKLISSTPMPGKHVKGNGNTLLSPIRNKSSLYNKNKLNSPESNILLARKTKETARQKQNMNKGNEVKEASEESSTDDETGSSVTEKSYVKSILRQTQKKDKGTGAVNNEHSRRNEENQNKSRNVPPKKGKANISFEENKTTSSSDNERIVTVTENQNLRTTRISSSKKVSMTDIQFVTPLTRRRNVSSSESEAEIENLRTTRRSLSKSASQNKVQSPVKSAASPRGRKISDSEAETGNMRITRSSPSKTTSQNKMQSPVKSAVSPRGKKKLNSEAETEIVQDESTNNKEGKNSNLNNSAERSGNMKSRKAERSTKTQRKKKDTEEYDEDDEDILPTMRVGNNGSVKDTKSSSDSGKSPVQSTKLRKNVSDNETGDEESIVFSTIPRNDSTLKPKRITLIDNTNKQPSTSKRDKRDVSDTKTEDDEDILNSGKSPVQSTKSLRKNSLDNEAGDEDAIVFSTASGSDSTLKPRQTTLKDDKNKQKSPFKQPSTNKVRRKRSVSDTETVQNKTGKKLKGTRSAVHKNKGPAEVNAYRSSSTGRLPRNNFGSQEKRSMADSENGDALRRSTRTKLKPVEYWTGERVRYKVGTDFCMEVVGLDPGQPAVKSSVKKQAVRQKRLPSNFPVLDEVAAGDEDMEPKLVTMSYEGGISELECFSTLRRGVNLTDGVVLYRGLEIPGMTSGYIKIDPSCSIEDKAENNFTFVFYVFSGHVKVTINETVKTLKECEIFVAPKGSRYQITNESDCKAILACTRYEC